jgi:hypothetical protein
MTTPGFNEADPVLDADEPRIEQGDETLPPTPDHDDIVDEADQREPEDQPMPVETGASR